MNKLSVAIITRNEKDNIRQCLETVKWADEIVIMDAFSDDDTVKIAREYTSRIFQNKWLGFSAQKNLLLSRVSNDWVLSLDADERVSPELKERILAILSDEGAWYDGYYIPRKNYFFGKWVRHCGLYPGYVMRLFRRSKGRFQDRIVHESVKVEGKTCHLKEPLEHYTHRTITEYIEKMNSYTSLSADQLLKEGHRVGRFDLILRPGATFLKMYVAKLGFLDGLMGLVVSSLYSFYVFEKYAKAWEKIRFGTDAAAKDGVMKIALVRQKYHTYGGAERCMAMVAEDLAEKGHSVTVFIRRAESAPRSARIRFRSIRAPSKPPFLKTLCFVRAVQHLIDRERFDIVHSFEKLFYQDVYRTSDGCHREWMKKQLGLSPNVFERFWKRIKPSNLLALFLERMTFREGHYKMIIAISNRVKRDIMEHYDVPQDRIEIVYPGVDLEKFNPANRGLFRNNIRKELGLGGDEFVVLFIGSGFRRKGLDNLISALELLNRKRDSRLLVVGKGRKFYYMNLARKMGVGDKLIFKGHVLEPERYYAASDAMVLASIYEPFGNACLEALASGVPVAVSGESGSSEIISENVDGLIIHDALSAAEIAGKIEMTFDAGFREKLAVNGRALAEKYPRSRYIQQTLSVYRKVLDLKK